MTELNCFFDMDGQPITAQRWAELFEDRTGRTVGRDEVGTPDGRRIVITVWNGVRVPEAGDDIFGTALLDATGRFLAEVDQYPTKADALAGHQRTVEALRATATSQAT